MGKKKKKKSNPSVVLFLEEKGRQFSKELIQKATKWELAFKEVLDQTDIDYIFQHPVVCSEERLYILDFYIPSLHLAIELDGRAHYTKSGLKYDKARSAMLKKEGISVLRIQNAQSLEATPKKIKELLDLYELHNC